MSFIENVTFTLRVLPETILLHLFLAGAIQKYWLADISKKREGSLPTKCQQFPDGDAERPDVAGGRHSALEKNGSIFF